jgi:hypothetical protein
MNNAEDILDQASVITGWSEDSKLQLLCVFVDEQALTKQLQRFVDARIESENELLGDAEYYKDE